MSPLNFSIFFFRKIAIFVNFKGVYTISYLKRFEKENAVKVVRKTLVFQILFLSQSFLYVSVHVMSL